MSRNRDDGQAVKGRCVALFVAVDVSRDDGGDNVRMVPMDKALRLCSISRALQAELQVINQVDG